MILIFLMIIVKEKERWVRLISMDMWWWFKLDKEGRSG